MLLELGLPSFDSLIINSCVNLTRQLHCNNNSVIRQLCQTLGLHVNQILLILCIFVFPMYISVHCLFLCFMGQVPEIEI